MKLFLLFIAAYLVVISFNSNGEETLAANSTADYSLAKISFDKNYYRPGDYVRAILIDEDVKNVAHEFFLTSVFIKGWWQGGGVTEDSPNSGKFVIVTRVNISGDEEFGISLKPTGDALIAFYHDVTIPESRAKIDSNKTQGIWIFAIAPFRDTSSPDTLPSVPLFFGNDPFAMHTDPNFIVKTRSAIQNLRILENENKIMFVNAADEKGLLEMQIPREAMHDIGSVSISHTTADFTLNKNATHFNIKIGYPEGTSEVEIFDLDIETPIVFLAPELVDQQGNEPADIRVGSQILIQSEIINSQTKILPFAYIVQIKDHDAVTVSLSWLTGELPAQDSFRGARSWIPEESGDYTIETFLWNNLETPLPLAPSKNIEVQIIA